MNFVAHAVVAERLGCSSLQGFGAMVPDLANMVSVIAGSRSSPEMPAIDLDYGSSVHIATDDAFHNHPAFLALVRAAASVMDGRRHVNTAAAHVGIELLIDGWLFAQSMQSPYWAALDAGSPFCSGPWAELMAYLADDNPTRHYRSIDGCADRTWRILGGRRFLAEGRPTLAALGAGLNSVSGEVNGLVHQLVNDVVLSVDAKLLLR